MKLINICKNVISSTIKDDCLGMASEMAYNLTLTIFPFFVAITAVFGSLGTEETVNHIIYSINSIAPPAAIKLIETTLRETIKSSSSGVFTISFLIGIVFASNAINVLMKVLNKAYGVPETRPMWKLRAITIWVLIVFVIAVFFITNLIVMGKVILNLLNEYFYIQDHVIGTITFVRWPATFLMLLIIGLIIYYFMPNTSKGKKIKFISSIPGTLFFTVGWLGVSRLFGFYVENFASFNKVYGALGTVIVLLLWLYYTSLVILVGGEINSEFYKHLKSKES